MSSKKIMVKLGQDTPAYADFFMDAGASIDEIKAEALKRAGKITFTPSFDWSGLRIVEITGPDGASLGGDIPLQPCGEDLGLVTENWLRGMIPFASVRGEAERQAILREPSDAYPMRELQAEYHFREEADPKVVRFMAPQDACRDEIVLLAHKALVQLTAEHRIIPAKQCNGLEFEPFKLVIETFALDENADAPYSATIEVNPAFVQRLQALSMLCRKNDLWVVQQDASPLWDTDMIMRDDLLAVTREGQFWFSAHPKHADIGCETHGIYIDDLLSAIARRDGEDQDVNGFLWVDGVLFYASDSGYVRDMAENWLENNPGDWVIFHPDEYACSDDAAGFWSMNDGWTTLDGATRFHSMPRSPLPMGGSGGTSAQALCIGTMKGYTVMLAAQPDEAAFAFQCFAENEQHATEQAENAYPGHVIQGVYLAGSNHE